MAPPTGFTVDATGLILTWAVAQANVADSPNRLSRGQFFKFNAPSGGAFTAAQRDYLNTSVFRVSPTVAPTTTVLTLDAITPFRSARYGAPTVANTAGLVISSSQAFNGNIMSSFQIEVSARDVNVHRLYRGMVVNTYELSFGSGDIVTEKYTFMGRTMEANLASRIGTNSPVPPPAWSRRTRFGDCCRRT